MPLPEWPMTDTMSPLFTEKETLSTAFSSCPSMRYVFVRSFTSITFPPCYEAFFISFNNASAAPSSNFFRDSYSCIAAFLFPVFRYVTPRLYLAEE